MRLAPIFAFFALVIGCSAQGTPASKTTESNCSQFDEFCQQIKVRHASQYPLDIAFSLDNTQIVSTIFQDSEGTRRILSVTVWITNNSPNSIRSEISHEWYGGIPVPTDFIGVVKTKGESAQAWSARPAYLAGNLGTVQNGVEFSPGQSRSFNIRLDWPGTGSVPTPPLIDPKLVGKYKIKFLLFFKVDNRQYYAVSQEFELDYR